MNVKTNDIKANASYVMEGEIKFHLCTKKLHCTIDFSYGDDIRCGFSSCYNISMNSDRVIQGSTFQKQISHYFDSSSSSLCIINSTFFLELCLDYKNSHFNSHLCNEVTGGTINLIEIPIQNDNYTNAFNACLLSLVSIHWLKFILFDFTASGCESSIWLLPSHVRINNEVIANGDN